jgi:lipopolysaccharide export system protein LptA
LVLLAGGSAYAQQADTTDKIRITIAHSNTLIVIKTDSGTYTRFVGDVILYQGTDTLYCDSLYQNNVSRNFEAFSNVRFAQQGGTEGLCDYLKYTSAVKLAYMQGNVRLTDARNTLWCEELTYDLGTKTGVYTKGGTLQSDTTTVTSDRGVYNVKNKESRFSGNVIVTDPQYRIRSEDLGYNTETKVSTFFAKSVVTSDSGKSVLQTREGTYDSKRGIATFAGRSSIWNDGQYIEADSIHYNGQTGFGFARGAVVSTDTANHSTLYCGYAEYFRKKKVLWAMIKPVLEQANGKDTFYMRADTFYAAPMIKLGMRKVRRAIADSTDTATVKVKHEIKTVKVKEEVTVKGSSKKTKEVVKVLVDTVVTRLEEEEPIWGVPQFKYRLSDGTLRLELPEVKTKVTVKTKDPKAKLRVPIAVGDTSEADSTAPMFFLGYNHALIFSDSLQGKSDSVVYTRSDSLIRMITKPISWSRNSQITGDTIIIQMDSSAIKHLYVPNNATVVSQSGPDKAGLFDQVQGKTLTAWFTNNQISRMLVWPDAESIYYSKDEDGSYLGVNEAKAEKMHVYFDDSQIKKILFEKDVDQTMTPLEKADIPNLKLSRFKWLRDERPKSKEDLFK